MSAFLENIHVQQNKDADYSHKFYLFINPMIPRLEYVIKTEKEERTVLHIGQRKLLLSEIYFLTKYAKKDDYVIYAGSAPGTHIKYLSQLFPFVKFLLIDPNNFAVKPNNKIHILQEYFTDELAVKLSNKIKANKILFLSDIRRANPKIHFGQENENIIKKDMTDQIKWAKILNARVSMVKFRLPYGLKESDPPEIWPQGKLLIQPWAPGSSTETRLIFKNNAPDAKYNSLVYEEQMNWHNKSGRPSCYHHNITFNKNASGLDHCWDCTAEIYILRKYLKRFQQNVVSTDIDAMSSYITKHALYNTRPLWFIPSLKDREKIKEKIQKKSKIKQHLAKAHGGPDC